MGTKQVIDIEFGKPLNRLCNEDGKDILYTTRYLGLPGIKDEPDERVEKLK